MEVYCVEMLTLAYNLIIMINSEGIRVKIGRQLCPLLVVKATEVRGLSDEAV